MSDLWRVFFVNSGFRTKPPSADFATSAPDAKQSTTDDSPADSPVPSRRSAPAPRPWRGTGQGTSYRGWPSRTPGCCYLRDDDAHEAVCRARVASPRFAQALPASPRRGQSRPPPPSRASAGVRLFVASGRGGARAGRAQIGAWRRRARRLAATGRGGCGTRSPAATLRSLRDCASRGGSVLTAPDVSQIATYDAFGLHFDQWLANGLAGGFTRRR
jgi:hypothetical protein